MEKTVRQKRKELLKARLLVALDLTIVIGMLVGTAAFSLVTMAGTSSVVLHLLLSVFLNVAMWVFVAYYLLKRSGSW